MSQRVRTRFAPSPTGFLHVGGARTALFAWLVAKQANGDFILRIEDTDKSREVAEAEQHIMDCLRWLGLNWDEEPYRQSQRLAIYKDWADKLVAQGRAYADPYSPQELEGLRRQAATQKKPFLFRNHRPGSPPAWQTGMPLRFKSEPRTYSWHDEVLGDLSTGLEAIDDFILIKSDGFPTYNFAHIVDDHLTNITHVIRSQEFLPSVPKFLNLYEALQIDRPKLATLPYVMAPDGKRKLSKRDGAKDILDYQKEGYLPEAIVNFLASLGWNDGTEQEIFSVEELVKNFSLDRVHRGGARFDEARLTWMNGHYIRQLTLDELYERSKDFWPPAAEQADQAYKKDILALLQDRLKYLAELPDLAGPFFEQPKTDSLVQLFRELASQQNINSKDLAQMLQTVSYELAKSDFSQADIKVRLNKLLETLSSKPAILFSAIRIAISGTKTSPELFGTLEALGKDKTLKRLEEASSILEK